jgi:hypothetical protein
MKERFIASGGSPLIINGRVVIQMDTIPVTKAKLNVSASKREMTKALLLNHLKALSLSVMVERSLCCIYGLMRDCHFR